MLTHTQKYNIVLRCTLTYRSQRQKYRDKVAEPIMSVKSLADHCRDVYGVDVLIESSTGIIKITVTLDPEV